MEALVDSLVQNPLYYIGLLFALSGASGFLILLAGFLPGSPHFFTITGNDDHLHHYRVRSIHGVFIILATFIVWEIFRAFVGYFS